MFQARGRGVEGVKGVQDGTGWDLGQYKVDLEYGFERLHYLSFNLLYTMLFLTVPPSICLNSPIQLIFGFGINLTNVPIKARLVSL